MVKLVKDCPFCHAKTEIELTEQEHKDWLGGMLIQQAIPRLSVEDRETLISGFCKSCQEKVFG